MKNKREKLIEEFIKKNNVKRIDKVDVMRMHPFGRVPITPSDMSRALSDRQQKELKVVGNEKSLEDV